MPPNPAYADAMSGWPQHMYVGENVKGAIRCLAPGCTHTFTSNKSIESQVKHYSPEIVGNDELNASHWLLEKMHTLKKCMVCNMEFHQADSRDLFNHNIRNHSGYGDISVIQGFVMQVRTFGSDMFADTEEPDHFWKETFYLAYKYLERKMYRGTERYISNFTRLLGLRTSTISEDDLTDVLKKVVLRDQANRTPIHPVVFLSNLQYQNLHYDKDGKHKGIVGSEQEWKGLLEVYKVLYRTGTI